MWTAETSLPTTMMLPEDSGNITPATRVLPVDSGNITPRNNDVTCVSSRNYVYQFYSTFCERLHTEDHNMYNVVFKLDAYRSVERSLPVAQRGK